MHAHRGFNISRRAGDQLGRLWRTRARLQELLGREPSDDEIEKIREWTLETVRGTVHGSIQIADPARFWAPSRYLIVVRAK